MSNESKQSYPIGDVEQAAKEYALKWIPEVETDDYYDKKVKKNCRLEIEEHFENGWITGSQWASPRSEGREITNYNDVE